MRLVIFLALFLIFSLSPFQTYARVTPEDLLQQKRSAFDANLGKIQDNQKKQAVIDSIKALQEINQKVCLRFQEDINKMAVILEEEKARQNVTETVVAYGQGSTSLDRAAYYLNYAAEALAYQKIQDYTPNISGGNLSSAVNISSNNLKSDLNTLKNKILNAKAEVKKSLR